MPQNPRALAPEETPPPRCHPENRSERPSARAPEQGGGSRAHLRRRAWHLSRQRILSQGKSEEPAKIPSSFIAFKAELQEEFLLASSGPGI
jgi:hypothetical protein